MKGTLHKTEEGWVVRWPREDPRDPVPELPVHPDDLDSDIIRWAEIGGLGDKQIDFDWCVIITSDGKGKGYARLTEPQTGSKVDLQKLEAKFDKVFSEEIAESFQEWLASKRAQKERLSEIMNEDAKDGLYDTNTPMVERLKQHLDSITPEQFEQEIEYVRKDLEIEDVVMNGPQYIPEISDEEILKAAKQCRFEDFDISVGSFELGARWYRQQLKNR